MAPLEAGQVVSLLHVTGLLDPMEEDDDDEEEEVDDEAENEADDDLLLVTNALEQTARLQQLVCLLLPGVLPREYTRGDYYVKPRRPSHYHCVAHKYWDNREFIKHFRIDRATFLELADAIRPDVERARTNYKEPITAEQKLACTLLYLATGITMQQVSSLEGVGLTTVQQAVHEVAHALLRAFGDEYVVFPRTAAKMVEAAAAFELLQGLPQVIGALDGTHVPIKKPPKSGDNYYNRKGFPSINVSAVCNAGGVFTDVHIGWTGRVHDSTVLRDSPLFADITVGTLGQAMKAASTNIAGTRVPMQLICDSAYSCYQHFLPAIKTTMANTPAKATFNKKHAGTRQPVERGFGRMKARWRKLLSGLEVHIDRAPILIAVCFLLHNICEAKGHIAPEDDPELAGLEANYKRFYPDDGGAGGPAQAAQGGADGNDIRNALIVLVG